MMNNVIENNDYKILVESQIKDIIDFLVDKGEYFAITINMKTTNFNPELPQSIKSKFNTFTLLRLENYTFTTIKTTKDSISFEAGFGKENFGSIVTVPLFGIFQIIINESILYLNPLAQVEKFIDDMNFQNRSRNSLKL